jgi:hypothetical protein
MYAATIAYDQRLTIWRLSKLHQLHLTDSDEVWHQLSMVSESNFTETKKQISFLDKDVLDVSILHESELEVCWHHGAIVNIAEISSLFSQQHPQESGLVRFVVAGEGFQILECKV